MTNIVSGGHSSINYQTFDDVQLQQATKTLDKPTDSIDSLAGTKLLSESINGPYISPSNKIALPTPMSSEPVSSTQVMQGLQQLRQNAGVKASSVQEQITQAVDNQALFNEAIGKQISALPDSLLREVAYQPGMSMDTIREEIVYAVLHPEVDVPAEVRAIAEQISSTALKEAQQVLGPDWTPTSLAWIQDAVVSLNIQSLFDEVISHTPGLSKAEIAELHFAMENPDAVKSLSPRLQKIFQQVMGKVISQAQMQYGIPDTWQFSPDKNSPVGLTTAFDQKFEKVLGAEVEKGKVTEAEARRLETLHYYPDADIPGAEKLKEGVAQLEKGILKELQKEWGFPIGYRPPANADDREALLNLIYHNSFGALLDSYTPPLTADQKALIRLSQGSSSTVSSLPPELQAAANSIKAKATQETIEAYGLPKDWGPKVCQIADKGRVADDNKVLTALMGHLSETLAIGKKHVNTMPEGDIKNTYLVFLSVVATAMAKYAEVLTVSQIGQANMGRVLSQMRLDTQLNKIKAQQNALEEMKKQAEGKGGFLGFIMNAITWIVNILLIVVTCGAAIGLVVDAAMRGQNLATLNLIDYSFKVAGRICGQPMATWLLMIGYVALLALSIVTLNLLIVIVLLAVVLVDVYLGNGDILKNIFISFGIPPTAAMAMSMVICIIISVIIDIILSIIIEVFTAGIGTELTVALWAAKITLYVSRVTAFIVKCVTTVTKAIKVVKALKFLIQFGQAIVDVATACVKALVKVARKVAAKIAAAAARLDVAVSAVGDALKSGVKKVHNSVAVQAIEEVAKKFAEAASGAAAEAAAKSGLKAAAKKISETAAAKAAGELFDAVTKNFVAEAFKGYFRRGMREAWDSLFNWEILASLRNTDDAFETWLKRASHVGDVSYHKNQVNVLKNVERSQVKLKAAEKAMHNADMSTTTVKQAKLLKAEHQAARDDFVAALCDYKRFDYNGQMRTAKIDKDSLSELVTLDYIDKKYATRCDEIKKLNIPLENKETMLANAHRMHQTDMEDYVLRDGVTAQVMSFQILREKESAISRAEDARKIGRADNMTDLSLDNAEVIRKKEADVEALELAEQGQAVKSTQATQARAELTAMQANQAKLDELHELEAAGDPAAAAKRAELLSVSAPAAKAKHKAAIKEFDDAALNFERIQDQMVLDFYFTVKGVVRGAFGTVEGVQGVVKNYMAGKLAMLKAEMDAYATEMNYIIKLLKDLQSRLMESVTEMGEAISETGRLIKRLYSSNSQTMSSLAMA